MTRSLVWIALFSLIASQAQAAQLCGWLKESNEPDQVRMLELWLQSDSDLNFLIKIVGKGIVTGMGESNSPETATYHLFPGQADKAWSYGATLDPPGAIDETVEIHQMPADIFSGVPTPLMAKFVFKRNVPASEKRPPATFARKQCAAVTAGPPPAGP